MRDVFSRFLSDQSGATAIEYALIACGIAMAIITTVQSLGVSLNTVRSFVRTIYKKLDVNSRTEAVLAATRLGLVRGTPFPSKPTR